MEKIFIDINKNDFESHLQGLRDSFNALLSKEVYLRDRLKNFTQIEEIQSLQKEVELLKTEGYFLNEKENILISNFKKEHANSCNNHSNFKISFT